MSSAVSAPTDASEDVALDTLTTLARTRRDNEELRFNYRNAAGDVTDRHVEPHHVVPLGRRWYIISWDLNRANWRTFRLDRINNRRPTGQRFNPRPLPATDPINFVTESIASAPANYHVEFVVEAPLQTVQEELGPWGTATIHGPDTTHISMKVDDLSWAVLMLAALNVDVHYAAPAELRHLLEQLSTRFNTTGPFPTSDEQP